MTTTTTEQAERVRDLVRDIHDAIAALAGVARYPDLTEAIDQLAALATPPAASHSQAPAEPLGDARIVTDEALDRIMRAAQKLGDWYAYIGDHNFPKHRVEFRESVRAAIPTLNDERIRVVIKELRTYNPAADEYRGKYIRHVWARDLEAALATLTSTGAAASPASDARNLIEECRAALHLELTEGWDIEPPLRHVKQAHDKCVAWLAVSTGGEAK